MTCEVASLLRRDLDEAVFEYWVKRLQMEYIEPKPKNKGTLEVDRKLALGIGGMDFLHPCVCG